MPPRLPRVSVELFVLPVEDAFLVYAPLRRAAFLASAAVVNRLADWQDGDSAPDRPGDEELASFLRRLEILDAPPERPPIAQFQGDPRPTAVTLFLTTACNLRCTYCYASAGDTPVRVMPLEVARRGVDFVLNNARDLGRPGIEVAYHGGGEPTVNWRTLTESLAYARGRAETLGLKVEASLARNGVLDDARIDWVLQGLA